MLTVNEIFHSIQGESSRTGSPACSRGRPPAICGARGAVATQPTLKVSTPRQLFRGNCYNVVPGGSGSPRPQSDVTADGRLLLVLESDNAVRHRIVVVQNWLEEFKRRFATN